MIRHVWTVVCSDVVLDKYSNQMSLHDVVEQLNVAAGDPHKGEVLPIELAVVTLWERSDWERPAQGEGMLTVTTPSGPVGGPLGPYRIDLSRKRRRSRAFLRLRGFPIRGPGRYALSVSMRLSAGDEWREVAQVPIEVVPEPEDTAQDVTIEALGAAAREWVEASAAVRAWMSRHTAFWWPESGEPAPPEPETVTSEALDELEYLRLEEQLAKDKFARINKALLDVS